MSAHPIREFLCLAVIGALLACSASAQSNCKSSPEEAALSRAGTPGEAAVESILRKGFAADQEGNRPKARAFYFEALDAAEKLPKSSPEKRQAMMIAARAYAAEGNQKHGTALAERVLEMDEEALGPQDAQVAVDLGQIALQYERRAPEEAGKLFDQALELANTTSKMDCHQSIGLLNNAARFYVQRGQYWDAERALKGLIESASGVPWAKPFLANGQDLLARVLHLEGKDAEAEEFISASSSAIPQNPKNPDLSNAFSDLNKARMYKEMDDPPNAELFYRKAIAQFKAAPPRIGVAPLLSGLQGLAQICLKQGRNAEAEDILLEDLHLLDSVAGPQMPWAVRMLGSFGQLQDLYRQEGRLNEIEPLYQHAIEIQQKYLDPHDEALAFTFFGAGLLYRDEGKLEQSLPMYRQALKFGRLSFGRDTQRLLPILDSYADALTQLGHTNEARSLQAQASEIEQRHTAQSQPNR